MNKLLLTTLSGVLVMVAANIDAANADGKNNAAMPAAIKVAAAAKLEDLMHATVLQ